MDNSFKKAWRIVSPIVIYLVIERIVGFCVNFYYIMGRLDENAVWTDKLEKQLYLEVYDMLSNNTLLISGIVSLICIMIFYRTVLKEWKKRTYRIQMLESDGKMYIFTAMISVGFTLAVNLMINAYGLFKYNWDFAKVSQLIYSEPLYMQILVIGLIMPVCEELLFRGVIYERIFQSGSERAALILTSILFAFFHGTWVQVIYAFFFSCLMIYAYQRCGTFKIPLLFHILSNLSSLALRQFPIFSTLEYSVTIVVFALIGVLGMYFLKKSIFYTKMENR